LLKGEFEVGLLGVVVEPGVDEPGVVVDPVPVEEPDPLGEFDCPAAPKLVADCEAIPPPRIFDF
jgi:hypothetical protein